MSKSRNTEISDSGGVTIPAEIREELDLEPGDTLHWEVEDGQLRVEVVRERPGTFDDFEGYELGETNAVEVTENPRGPDE